MAITYNVLATVTGASSFNGTNNGFETTVTVSSGVSRLVVLCTNNANAFQVTSVTVSGTGHTTLTAIDNANNRSAAAATLVSPTSGSRTVRMILSGASTAVSMSVIEVFGDDTTGLRASASVARQLVTSSTVTVSGTVVGDVVFGVTCQQSEATISSSSPATELYNVAPTGSSACAHIKQDGANTSTTVTWTTTNNARFANVAIALKEASGGGGGNAPRSMFYHLQGMR